MAGQPHEHGRTAARCRLISRCIATVFLVTIIPSVAVGDSTDVARPDSLPKSADTTRGLWIPSPDGPAPIPVPSREQMKLDSAALAAILADTTSTDSTAPLKPVRVAAAVYDSLHAHARAYQEAAVWPMPQPVHLATVDAAGWLEFNPVYDVDAALGMGEARRYSRWGLRERESTWHTDGAPLTGRRLSFPQDVSFDPALYGIYDYDSIHATPDGVLIDRGEKWPAHARSSYVLRQGDYGETFSQGRFRRLLPSGHGIDMGFGFYEATGPFSTDDRDNRHLRLQVVGPAMGETGWSARFEQNRDETYIVPEALYGGLRPRRDDLNYSGEAALYHAPDSGDAWAAGLTRESSKHDLRDVTGYRLETHEHRWRAWGERELAGWNISGALIRDELDMESVEDARWGAWIEGTRFAQWMRTGETRIHWRLSDWDTDPVAPEFDLTTHFADSLGGLMPGVKLSRQRIVPTLFERNGLERTTDFSTSVSPFVRRYTEMGDPNLPAEWRNELTFFLTRPSVGDSSRTELTIEGHVAFVEDYTTWENTSPDFDTVIYRPMHTDARAAGVAIGVRTPLFWKFESWTGYAFKYAESVDHKRLHGYNPHKAMLILSWIAPQFHYGIDLRLNSSVLWWYGDRRITPTPYSSSPHVMRWDLSASAQMRSFVFHFSVQNVANFPYRTRSGEEYAVRALRLGFDWRFLD